jgi:uncharacterized protein (TIGR04168 family)
MNERHNNSIKIAVVGDVHEQWEREDELALQALQVDLVLFVGDFGNESVNIVRQIATLDLPLAAVFGNHDAWYTASAWGRMQAPYDRAKEDRVQQQLDILGKKHVGYSKLDFPQFNLSVVGSRPFSWGGKEWKNKNFLRDRFEVNNFNDSTNRIVAAAKTTAFDNIIFLGHNGPYGLGDRPEDPCGKDWEFLGGDFGDPDFADAISKMRNLGKNIPLVTFGHMHHRLRHTRKIERTPIYNSPDGTVYLNAACSPRIVNVEGKIRRNFSLVTLQNNSVSQVSLIWVGEDYSLVSERILFTLAHQK